MRRIIKNRKVKNSIKYIDEVKDDVTIMAVKEEENVAEETEYCVKTSDALKAIEMAKEEAKQEVAEDTLYAIKKGDFVTIYNKDEDKYVVGKLERITPLAFYFTTTNCDEKTYGRDKWTLKIEI